MSNDKRSSWGIMWSSIILVTLLSSNVAPIRSPPILATPHTAQVNGKAWLPTSKMLIL